VKYAVVLLCFEKVILKIVKKISLLKANIVFFVLTRITGLARLCSVISTSLGIFLQI